MRFRPQPKVSGTVVIAAIDNHTVKLNHARELKSLRKRARLLGFELVDRSSGEVLLNPVS